jgi:hypothetical protein
VAVGSGVDDANWEPGARQVARQVKRDGGHRDGSDVARPAANVTRSVGFGCLPRAGGVDLVPVLGRADQVVDDVEEELARVLQSCAGGGGGAEFPASGRASLGDPGLVACMAMMDWNAISPRPRAVGHARRSRPFLAKLSVRWSCADARVVRWPG